MSRAAALKAWATRRGGGAKAAAQKPLLWKRMRQIDMQEFGRAHSSSYYKGMYGNKRAKG